MRPDQRQQVLFLWLAEPSLNSAVIAWAFHDGTNGRGPQPTGEQPYADGIAAMGDGWRVFQVSQQQRPIAGEEHLNAHLVNEFVLERLIDTL